MTQIAFNEVFKLYVYCPPKFERVVTDRLKENGLAYTSKEKGNGDYYISVVVTPKNASMVWGIYNLITP